MTQATQPLVSIIVPVYNVERYVDECLTSIRAQTYGNLEILLVEDCSTDGSLKALAPHLEDPRVRLIRHERNGGLSAARNTGIEAAGGDYVMFVDSDDLVDVKLVAACVQAAEQSKAEVVLYGFVPFNDGERIPVVLGQEGDGSFERIGRGPYFAYPHFAWLKFLRRELLLNPLLRFPVGRYYEDWPFHWELGFTGANMMRLGQRGYFYRQRGDSITGSGDQKLFHILSAHLLVGDVVDRHAGDREANRIFAEKIHSGTWFVLATIDDVHLAEAVSLAKAHLQSTRTQRHFASIGSKPILMNGLLSLPQPFALAGFRWVRGVLAWVSPARRKAARQARAASAGAG